MKTLSYRLRKQCFLCKRSLKSYAMAKLLKQAKSVMCHLIDISTTLTSYHVLSTYFLGGSDDRHYVSMLVRQLGRDRCHLQGVQHLVPRGRSIRRRRLYLSRIPIPHEGHRKRRLIQLQPTQMDVGKLRLLLYVVKGTQVDDQRF